MKIADFKPRWFPSRPRLRVRRRHDKSIDRGLQSLEGRRLLSSVPAVFGTLPGSSTSPVQLAPPGNPGMTMGFGDGPRGSLGLEFGQLPCGMTQYSLGFGDFPPLATSASAAGGMVTPSILAPPAVVGVDSASASAGASPDATTPNPAVPGDHHEDISEATVDIDGTPTPEVAVVNAAAGRVTVYQGSNAVFTTSGLGQSAAVKLADLNDDGTPDLIIADSQNNRVLIFAGLTGGGFGAEVNGGQGFAVGTDPVGLTVGSMDGSGQEDLIVANRGSNDVSVFRFASVNSETGWEVTSQSTIQAGIAPVKTMLVDTGDGSGTLNLLICNSGSNDIYNYELTPTGQVNAAGPDIIPVAYSPSDMIVGRFDRRPDLDMVTEDDTSDRLTYIGGVFTPHPYRQDIVTGITNPVGAFALTLGDSGISDVMVAGSDGRIALLQAGEGGLQLTDLTVPTGLSNVTAIAAGDYSSSGFDVYEASAGSDAVAVFRFDVGELAAAIATPTPDLATTVQTGDEAALVEMVPVGSSMFDIAGILWDSSEVGSAPTAATATSGVRATQVIGALANDPDSNQVVASSWSDEDDSVGSADDPTSWTRFVLGLDTALDSFHDSLAAIAEADALDWDRDPFLAGRGAGQFLADRDDLWKHSPGTDHAPTSSPDPARLDGPGDGWSLRPEASPSWPPSGPNRAAATDDPAGLLTAVVGSGVAIRFLVNASPPQPRRPDDERRSEATGDLDAALAWPEVFPPTSPHG